MYYFRRQFDIVICDGRVLSTNPWAECEATLSLTLRLGRREFVTTLLMSRLAGAVTGNTLSPTNKIFTLLAPTAVHTSGVLQQASQKLRQQDWYTAVFQPKMKNYHKGALVWDRRTIATQAADTNIAKYVFCW
jgi:hypothetical protein